MAELADVLNALRTAELATGEPIEFMLVHAGGMTRNILADGWTDDEFAPTHVQVDELEARELVRVSKAEGMDRTFALTDQGRKEADDIAQRALTDTVTKDVDLSWSKGLAHLRSLVERYEREGAPEWGLVVDGENESEADRTWNRELVRTGWLEEVDLIEQDTRVRPTREAMELVRGWPASNGEAVLAQLIAALDEQIASATEPERRTALQQVREGLAGAARDVAVGVLTELARRPI